MKKNSQILLLVSRAAFGALASLVALIPAIVSAAPAENSAAAPPGLFSDAPAPAVVHVPDTVVKHRPVHVNFDALQQARAKGALLRFNLFAEAEFVGEVEAVEARSDSDYTLTGRLQGNDFSSFTLVVNGDVMVMNARPGEKSLLEVRYLGGGVHDVRKADENLFKPCLTGPEHNMANQQKKAGVRAEGDPRPQRDAADFIDVMVVYTPAARAAAGGTPAMQALVNLGIAESNTAYQQSLITTRLRLVFQSEIAYTESYGGTNDLGYDTDLDRLTEPADGFIDQVHTWRDAYGADLVSLWIDNQQSCGLAWLMGALSPSYESLGFSVVNWDCATGNYSFPHELGHNMGCQHDRANGSSSLFSYSYGWRFFGTNGFQYRTIMAYAPGSRIQRFSNPDVSYFGTPTGVATGDVNEAHNALSINNAASTVANFRQTLVSTNNPPTITTQPVSQNVNVGANVTFSVVAGGTTPLSYQWKKNGSPISGATLSSYTTNNVQVADAASYSVTVTNAFGTTNSADAVLTVNHDPPTILAQPASQSVSVGANVTFSVVAGGTPPLAYQWRRNGSPISGATLSSYTTNNVQLADAGSYSVVITNLFGTTNSADAVLTVSVFPPTITTQPASQTVNAGASATFSIVAGGTLPLSYQWKRDGSPISGATLSSYTTNNVQVADAGSYSVLVTNLFGMTNSANAVLTVNPTLSLVEALDAPAQTWTSGGTTQWFGQSTITHDASDAAQSGAITNSQESWFETTVTGPGTATFWWKASSETNYDFLRLNRNGVEQFSISGEVDWQQRMVSIPAGSQTLRWRYTKDSSLSDGQDKGWVDQFVFSSGTLATALDNENFTWLTTNSVGGAPWAWQSSVTHDGVDAAASGTIADNGFSGLQTTVVGPGTLSFWWKVSSELDFDYLIFGVDGYISNYISGNVNWTQYSQPIASGMHTVEWEYVKDDSFLDGSDKGWVDQVVFLDQGGKSSIFLSNSIARVGPGHNFSLQFDGTLGASYQLQASTDLSNWSTLTTVTATNLPVSFVDSNILNYPQRFFRVVSP